MKSKAVEADEAFERDALVDALLALEPSLDTAQVRIVRAPGRVNLIGEHTDYNLGLVLPMAIDREIRIAYVPSGDGRVELTRLDTAEHRAFDLFRPRPSDGSWLDYVAGTAFALREAGLPTAGLRGVIGSNLPEDSGLSSSAAIELAAAWTLLDGAASEVDPLRLATICQRAENGYVGVQSGLMDQFAEACGIPGHALLLDCRSLEWHAVALPDDVSIVICHTGSARRLGGSEYNLRRSQCDAAVAALARSDPSIHSLRDVTMDLLDAHRNALDPVVARRAEHVIAENERVRTAISALEAGDLGRLGDAMRASHASLRDLYEVSSPELDALVDIATDVPGVIGARMTGAGFGGCTVNVVRPGAVDRLRTAVVDRYPARTGLTPRVFAVKAAAGAGRLA
jgi:galactokinase